MALISPAKTVGEKKKRHNVELEKKTDSRTDESREDRRVRCRDLKKSSQAVYFEVEEQIKPIG
jgi:hypothetical protein